VCRRWRCHLYCTHRGTANLTTPQQYVTTASDIPVPTTSTAEPARSVSSTCSRRNLPYQNGRGPRGFLGGWKKTLALALPLTQSCPWVHFVWPDQTQPIIWLTQPNPTHYTWKKFGPKPTQPTTTNKFNCLVQPNLIWPFFKCINIILANI